jgi:hypothetical protein
MGKLFIYGNLIEFTRERELLIFLGKKGKILFLII